LQISFYIRSLLSNVYIKILNDKMNIATYDSKEINS